jgi:hypothetical protein
MVPTPWPSTIVPPVALVRLTKKVSAASLRVLPQVAIETVRVPLRGTVTDPAAVT